MSEPLGKHCWYELMTTDTEAAGRFYSHVVGWNLFEPGGPHAGYTLLKVGDQGMGGMMKLPDEACAAGARPGWTGYIWVPEVEAAIAKVVAAGGKVHREPADIPHVGRFAVVADPQGAVFTLFRHFGDQEAPPVPVNALGHVGWHELFAADNKTALEFYAGQFGWEASEALDMGPMGTYRLFTIRADQPGGQCGGMANKPDAFPQPVWLYYFNVDDIDAAVARVKSAGGQVLMGPHEVPGGSMIIQGLDPQGAMFALVDQTKATPRTSA
jgi:predicted enzyme related to lactoylglutathione lyase